jgi:hypothetical protein
LALRQAQGRAEETFLYPYPALRAYGARIFKDLKDYEKPRAFWNAVFVLLRLSLTGNLQPVAGNRFSMMACSFQESKVLIPE